MWENHSNISNEPISCSSTFVLSAEKKLINNSETLETQIIKFNTVKLEEKELIDTTTHQLTSSKRKDVVKVSLSRYLDLHVGYSLLKIHSDITHMILVFLTSIALILHQIIPKWYKHTSTIRFENRIRKFSHPRFLKISTISRLEWGCLSCFPTLCEKCDYNCTS